MVFTCHGSNKTPSINLNVGHIWQVLLKEVQLPIDQHCTKIVQKKKGEKKEDPYGNWQGRGADTEITGAQMGLPNRRV